MRIHTRVPEGVTEAPGVVVAIHGPGLDAFIEDRVDALARRGYVAAAPDLYHRQPDDGADTMTRFGRLRDAEILEDLDAAGGSGRRGATGRRRSTWSAASRRR